MTESKSCIFIHINLFTKLTFTFTFLKYEKNFLRSNIIFIRFFTVMGIRIYKWLCNSIYCLQYYFLSLKRYFNMSKTSRYIYIYYIYFLIYGAMLQNSPNILQENKKSLIKKTIPHSKWITLRGLKTNQSAFFHSKF